ncbi:helix-turn-helix domain-containing protein [Peterkaempfera bronchialis]|uniref:XRE family transcriptional regulator n=1 Tax=Peterkaempfera bronchialis TaxID=2126346 RepID=A0A345ST19_9ACTN|nr:helix-turn-helix transcriptional regulator [Peterkaempfera bronchialis]AXI76874.1 XRE family transcriptional regulator [Peterkaempfera bronchialis]
MTDFQREREMLGGWLHRLRREAGLNGKELAADLGWAASKVSRIEHGRQTPSEADIAAWAKAVGAPDAAEDLAARLHALDSHYVSWRRSLRAGHAPRQRVAVELDSRTRLLRAFETGVVPGLLQTAEYARHLFAQLCALRGTPDDGGAAVRVRMERQRALYESGKEFHFVLTTAALRTRVCPVEVHRGQLDRLLAVGSLGNLRFGVIPDGAPLPLMPLHPFWIFDDRLVQVETWSAELNLTDRREVALYEQVFERHAGAAAYGPAARRIVAGVMAELSAGPALPQQLPRTAEDSQ